MFLLQPRPGTVPPGKPSDYYKFAHTGLSKGDDVFASGLIEDREGIAIFNNSSGHYKISETGIKPALEEIKEALKEAGIESKINDRLL